MKKSEDSAALPSPQRCNEIVFPGGNEQVCVAAAGHEGGHTFWPRELAGAETNSATSADYVRAMEAQGIKPINFTPDDMEPRLHAKPGSYLRAKGKPVALPSSPMNPLNERATPGLASTFWHDYCEREKVMESPVSSDWWGFQWAGYVLARYEQLRGKSVPSTPSPTIPRQHIYDDCGTNDCPACREVIRGVPSTPVETQQGKNKA